ATLTSLSRLTPLFQELQVEELFTFFDLAKLLGFTTITVSDGRKFTHQITIK
ncbi:MAG: molybdopterin-guanine dinucleotide biosynthesis protein A, partial [Alphaproteobacteria bacterium]|nr:molybdopterin-guanine dinucleotide biosynthesis protein A [Alphaproteobacteria bacterium]